MQIIAVLTQKDYLEHQTPWTAVALGGKETSYHQITVLKQSWWCLHKSEVYQEANEN